MTTEQPEERSRPRAGREWPPPGGFVPRGVPAVPRRSRHRERDELPMGTVTFLFSDIVGSTPETQRRGDRRARAFYRIHDGVVRALAGQREGHIVRQDGDGFFITFRSTRQALRCAIEMQRGLQSAYAELDERARIRIGLHVGETVEEGGDYYGTAVNLAARVRGEAGADQIVVTALVRSLASGEPEFQYRFLREAELRGISGRVRLYELLWREEEIAAAQAAEASADAAPAMPGISTEAGLRDYAATLANWCAGPDLSEWRGRYVPLTARLLQPRSLLLPAARAGSSDLQELIAENHRLVVIGEGGSGKTTALLEATRRAAQALSETPSAPIPVFAPLRAWRPEQDLVDLVGESMAVHGLRRSRDAVLELLQSGRLLLLLDGVNEIADTILDRVALLELDSIARRFPGCGLVISTRQHRASTQFTELPVAALQPLRPHLVLQYITQYAGSAERAEAIFRSLGGRDRAAWLESGSLVSLARSPLMLNVIISQELTGGGTLRPARAAVIEAYVRQVFRVDVQRGSHLAPEVKEALLAAVAYAATLSERTGPLARGDLAQMVVEALTELRAEALAPADLDAPRVLAEIDRRFLPPLLPDAEQALQYDWAHALFRDFFTALDLRRRFFPPGRTADRAPLQALLAGDGWDRWSVACVLLAELLDDAGLLGLVETCLRADNELLACRCFGHSGLARRPAGSLAPGSTVQRLAEILRLRSETGVDGAALQDPFAVVCEALLERQPAPDAGAEDEPEPVAPLAACAGTALLAAVADVDTAGVLAALSLGLAEPELRAIAWAFGRDSRDVQATRARLQRICAMPAAPVSPEQGQLQQGLLLALAGSPELLLLALCRRQEAMINADLLPAHDARRLARHTAGVHAPLARRLLLFRLAGRLDDLVLSVLDHEQYRQAMALSEELRLMRREHRLDWLSDVLDERLQRLGIEADVQTAMPSFSGIAAEVRRLGELHLPRAALRGLGRIAINVPDEQRLERVEAVLDEVWPGITEAETEEVPLTPAIARPGRRELVAYPPEGGFVRVLVQTQRPDEIDYARRATEGGPNRLALHARMRRLLAELASAGEDERVFVLTASGEVVALPEGATALDFAYYLHTQLGHRAASASINGREEPLSYCLRHGDRVTITLDAGRTLPPAEWLERPGLLRTARARKAVQQALDAAWRADAVSVGREIVAAELRAAEAPPQIAPRLLKTLGFQREERLYEAAGFGEFARREIAYTIAVLMDAAASRTHGGEDDPFAGWVPVALASDDSLRPRYARCCRPQPGDSLVACRSGQTAVVHHAACPEAAGCTGRAALAAHWLLEAVMDRQIVRVQTRRGREIVPAIRRAAQESGLSLLDLSSGREVAGAVTITLELPPAAPAAVEALLAAVRRLPDVSAVALLERAKSAGPV
ncbi:MAG TPA: TGS domain-containing protein [Dehalococcoidia bacterium]|nr:TGS domain-containing protein [Dehalococcoidia bacterium]